VELYNLYSEERLQHDEDDPPGYECDYRRLGPLIGAQKLGTTLYELPPGNSNCPYHYEYGREEWLLCVQGAVTVRTPEGEVALRRGDVIVFPEGPAGAHKVTNTGDETARVLIFSNTDEPSGAVYPDSDKIGFWSGPKFDNRDHVLVKRESAVEYWDGEV